MFEFLRRRGSTHDLSVDDGPGEQTCPEDEYADFERDRSLLTEAQQAERRAGTVTGRGTSPSRCPPCPR